MILLSGREDPTDAHPNLLKTVMLSLGKWLRITSCPSNTAVELMMSHQCSHHMPIFYSLTSIQKLHGARLLLLFFQTRPMMHEATREGRGGERKYHSNSGTDHSFQGLGWETLKNILVFFCTLSYTQHCSATQPNIWPMPSVSQAGPICSLWPSGCPENASVPTSPHSSSCVGLLRQAGCPWQSLCHVGREGSGHDLATGKTKANKTVLPNFAY